jgi:hypothetical protein
VSAAFDAVVAWLEGDGWPTATRVDDLGEHVATSYKSEAGLWACRGHVDVHERFAFYSLSPLTVPEPRRAAVADYLTRANWGLVVGNFELDLGDGEVRLKTSIDFEGGELTPPLIRNLILANVRVMDLYLPGLAATVEGGGGDDAAALIERIEEG